MSVQDNFIQVAQLSQRDLETGCRGRSRSLEMTTLLVTEYFTKSLKFTPGHSKRHC